MNCHCLRQHIHWPSLRSQAGELVLAQGPVSVALPQVAGSHGVAYTCVVSRGLPLLVESSTPAKVVGGGHWKAFGSLDVLDSVPQNWPTGLLL